MHALVTLFPFIAIIISLSPSPFFLSPSKYPFPPQKTPIYGLEIVNSPPGKNLKGGGGGFLQTRRFFLWGGGLPRHRSFLRYTVSYSKPRRLAFNGFPPPPPKKKSLLAEEERRYAREWEVGRCVGRIFLQLLRSVNASDNRETWIGGRRATRMKMSLIKADL